MGIDAALGIKGNAMNQWQQSALYSNQRLAHEQYHLARNMNAMDLAQISYYSLGALPMPKLTGRSADRDCEYCGSQDSITDHGNGLMKCANCGAS